MPDLVGSLDCRFSHVMAHVQITRTLVNSILMKKRSISIVSDASLKSYLKKSSVKARIMCCFGVLEKENLSNFIPQITINKQPILEK